MAVLVPEARRRQGDEQQATEHGSESAQDEGGHAAPENRWPSAVRPARGRQHDQDAPAQTGDHRAAEPRGEQDLAGGAALVEGQQRLRTPPRAGTSGRRRAAARRSRGAARAPPTRVAMWPGRLQDVRAPADADDGDVVEQQPVDLDGRDLAGGEADDQQPAVVLEAAQRVGEPVAADRVDDDVDPPPAVDGVLEAVGEDELVGAGLERDGALLGRRGHGDDAAGAEGLGDLDRGGADAAGGALHEHGLAGLQAAALDEGEVGRAVVEDDRGALLVRHRVGQRERRRRAGRRPPRRSRRAGTAPRPGRRG